MLKIFTILANLITFDLFNLSPDTKLAHSIHFFIEDTSKILVLMTIMIYVISWLRAGLNTNVVRDYLNKKNRFVGYVLASLFGAITPFCSCSSIPLFITFTKARIPAGITMSFLITSPMINEVAVVLLGSLLGLKFTIYYILAGILSGIAGGIFFDLIKSDRFIKDFTDHTEEKELIEENHKLTFIYRHEYATEEVFGIVKALWKWVVAGVGIGAAFHGYLPSEFVTKYLSGNSWYTVPSAVILGIPLYSSATGVIPSIRALILKGLPLGTAIAFMMSTVAASTPEFIMLSKVMKKQMLIIFFFLLLTFFTLTGWFFNYII